MKVTNYDDVTKVQQYQVYPLLHRYVGKPQFLRFIGEVKDQTILDLGCGYGHYTYDLWKKGARCIGVDPSKEFINRAIAQYPQIKFLQLKGSNLKGIKSHSLDKVVLCFVLQNISSRSEFQNIFKECHRVLKPQGELILSIIHPSIVRTFSDRLRKVRLPQDGHYFKTGMKWDIDFLLNDLSFISFHNNHWTLDDISNQLSRNQFVITSLKEPKAQKNQSNAEVWEYLQCHLNTPHYLFIKARLDYTSRKQR